MQGVLFSAQLPTYAPFRRNSSIRNHALLDVVPRLYDLNFHGIFRVAGTTKVAGTPDVPVSRLTMLFDRNSKRSARVQISNGDGSYEFKSVKRGPWFVIAFDHTGEYNAVIADNVFGEPM